MRVPQVSLDLSAADHHHRPLDTPSLAAIAQLTGLTALDLSLNTLPHLRPLSCLTALRLLRLNNVDCPGGGWRLHDMPAQLRKVGGALCMRRFWHCACVIFGTVHSFGLPTLPHLNTLVCRLSSICSN